MSGRNDIVLSFAIFFIFFTLIFINLLLISLEELKKDFVKYRCVPVFMPFVGVIGENPVTNFAFCVKDLLGKFIPDLLAPLHLSDNILTKNINGLLNSLKSLRAFLNKIRTMITEIIQLIMSIFLFLVVGIQEISISLKDLFSKTIATAFVFRYILEGGKLTGESAWNGVPGKAIKGLASMCFHPNTLVKLENGTCKLISNIEVGDILKNGQLVYGTMKLHNLDNNNNYIEKLYKFPGEFYDNKIHDVLVSGSHLIYNNITEKFIHVKHHPEAILTTIDTKLLICLITSDHTIPIGNLIYHDWEDKQQSTS
jgi:hypothetical protein